MMHCRAMIGSTAVSQNINQRCSLTASRVMASLACVFAEEVNSALCKHDWNEQAWSKTSVNYWNATNGCDWSVGRVLSSFGQ